MQMDRTIHILAAAAFLAQPSLAAGRGAVQQVAANAANQRADAAPQAAAGPDRVGGWASDRVLVKLAPGATVTMDRDGAFAATAVRDPCGDRRKVIEGSWTRTAAARLTPDS